MTTTPAIARTSRAEGLHDRLNRILHWDVNVSNLENTIAFYEALTSFRAGDVVTELGAGPLVGQDRATYRSSLLRNSNRSAPVPTLNLVQWLDPEPHGTPYASQACIGYFRVVIHVADLDLARAAAVAWGAAPFAPTTGDDFRFRLGSVGLASYRVFAVHDPDGIVVEFIESELPKLSVVAQGTGMLHENLSFYTDILGLDFTDTVETPGPVPNVYVPDGEPVSFSGAFFRVRGDDRGYLDWLEHDDPTLHGTPYSSANHLGVIRCAIEVDDLDAAAQALADARWNGSPVRTLSPPIDLDFGPPLGRRRTLAFADPEGVAYQLVEQQSYPWATLPTREAPRSSR